MLLEYHPCIIKPRHFTLAAMCQGDVPHSFDPPRFPFDLSFGLSIGNSKLPTGQGWLSVIERGVLTLDLTA
jgi:hypothetical protein